MKRQAVLKDHQREENEIKMKLHQTMGYIFKTVNQQSCYKKMKTNQRHIANWRF